MKRKIFLVSLVIVALVFTFCAGGGNGGGSRSGSGNKSFDKYFEDVKLEMENNIWVDCESGLDVLEHCSAIGVTNVEYTKVDGEERVAVTYRIISDTLPSAWGQDAKTITIRQGESFSSGREPQFRCRGGKERNESTGVGLIDYAGAAYTPYKPLVPIVVDKETFENNVLAKVSAEEKEYLLTLYEHGSAPKEMEAFRVMATFGQKLKDEDLEYFLEAYKRERETARWFTLQEGIDEDKLLAIMAKVETGSGDEKYDYKANYIRKWYFVKQPEGHEYNKYVLGMDKGDWEKTRDIFFRAGYTPSLEWTLYFDPTTKDRKSGEERTLDLYQPFILRENCTTGCYNFENVTIKSDIPGYRPRPTEAEAETEKETEKEAPAGE